MQEDSQPPAAAALSAGITVLGRYKIRSLQGKGAQASVFVAEDLQLSRDVALKVFHMNQSQSAPSNFMREAQILASLNHRGIVQIFAAGQLDSGEFCLIMELVKGESLAELLARQTKLSYEQFVAIFTQVLEALSYLHQKGILHRDIKPGNILLVEPSTAIDTEGGKGSGTGSGALRIPIKLVDFGIAKIFEQDQAASSQTQTQLVGSAAYMSPEQCSAKPVDQRSDIYSVACVMFESLAGQPPFTGDSDLDIMYKHVSEAIPKLAAPNELAEFIGKALEKSPANRFASADEMMKAMPRLNQLKDTDKSGILRYLLIGSGIVGIIAIIYFCSSTGAIRKPALPVKENRSFSKLEKRDGRLLAKRLNDPTVPLDEQLKVAEEIAQLPGEWNLEPRLESIYKILQNEVALRHHKEAAPLIQRMLREIESVKDPGEKSMWLGRIYFQKYLFFETKGDKKTAATMAEKCISTFEKCPVRAVANLEIANLFERQIDFAIIAKDWKTAEKLSARTKEFLQKSDLIDTYPPIVLQSLFRSAHCLAHAGKYEEAFEQIEESNRLARTNPGYMNVQPHHLIALANDCITDNNLAPVARIQSIAEKIIAEKNHGDGLPEYYQNEDDRVILCASRWNLYCHQNKSKEALDQLQKWKAIAESQFNKSTCRQVAAEDAVDLGLHFQQMKDLDTAEHIFQMAQKLYARFPSAPGRGNAEMRLGSIYLARHEYAKAEEFVRKGLELRQKEDPQDKSNVKWAEEMLAQIARHKGQ